MSNERCEQSIHMNWFFQLEYEIYWNQKKVNEFGIICFVFCHVWHFIKIKLTIKIDYRRKSFRCLLSSFEKHTMCHIVIGNLHDYVSISLIMILYFDSDQLLLVSMFRVHYIDSTEISYRPLIMDRSSAVWILFLLIITLILCGVSYGWSSCVY
jgi:hypothetical protein